MLGRSAPLLFGEKPTSASAGDSPNHSGRRPSGDSPQLPWRCGLWCSGYCFSPKSKFHSGLSIAKPPALRAKLVEGGRGQHRNPATSRLPWRWPRSQVRPSAWKSDRYIRAEGAGPGVLQQGQGGRLAAGGLAGARRMLQSPHCRSCAAWQVHRACPPPAPALLWTSNCNFQFLPFRSTFSYPPRAALV